MIRENVRSKNALRGVPETGQRATVKKQFCANIRRCELKLAQKMFANISRRKSSISTWCFERLICRRATEFWTCGRAFANVSVSTHNKKALLDERLYWACRKDSGVSDEF